MTTLVGPCMLLAPLVAVLALLALPLWPVVLAILGAAWLVLRPVEWILVRLGVTGIRGWSAAVGRAFLLVLRPWRYFEPVARGPGESEPAPPAPPA